MLYYQKYNSRYVIHFFTSFEFLHNFELNRIIFKTISKECRFSKVVKNRYFFKHQFRRRSYFWHFRNLNSEFRSSNKQDLINSFLLSNVNFALSLLSNTNHYYRNYFLLTWKWQSSRRFLRIESVSYFHRYDLFDDDLNRYFFEIFSLCFYCK